MSRRAKVHEVSSPISLFPFIGILLCTMGALLVVLVAVSRSAKDSAEKHVAARQQAGASAAVAKVAKKLTAVRQYSEKLGAIRGEGEKALRNEQKQLSHMDDHIRRLREQLQSLQLAEVELDALEEEHYDDRKQAEREVERLQKLVVELQDAVQAQRAEFAKHKKSYALVPYKHGANGTYRRPIYLECVKGELIMQPEGVSVTEDDLRPPMGAGNPLAAALRAARDHIVRLYPEEGKSRDTEPYPLMIVRPEGAAVAMRARRAIDAGDFDFGIEYVEADWKLKYPAPDPKLAELAQIAIDQARVRQEVLAEAAPRAFSRGGMASSGEFEYGDEPGGLRRGPVYEVRRKQGTGGGSGRYGEGGDEFGGGDGGDGDIGSGGGEFGGTAGSGLDGGAGGGLQYASGGAGPSGSEGGAQSAGGNSANAMSGSGGGSGEGGTDGGYGVASGGVPGGPAPSGTTVGGAGSIAGGPASSGSLTGGGSAASGTFGRPPEGGQHGAGVVGNSPEAGVGMTSSESGQGPSGVSMMAGAPPATASDPHGDRNRFQQRERDWAIGQKPARAVPIQRAIRVVVRGDQLALLPENGPADGIAPANDTVQMGGDTVEALDTFVARVRTRVESWGIAGDGLYWRPVLTLTVGPDGQRRADDLARLLKNSGIELHRAEVANNPSQGNSNETR